MKKIKPLIAYAVVSKTKPQLKHFEIYDKQCAGECVLGKDEKIVRVIITAYDK